MPSIRPRHGAVEKQQIPPGELPTEDLQFGHGTEPWRNASPEWYEIGHVVLQFGHGTEPWRNNN